MCYNNPLHFLVSNLDTLDYDITQQNLQFKKYDNLLVKLLSMLSQSFMFGSAKHKVSQIVRTLQMLLTWVLVQWQLSAQHGPGVRPSRSQTLRVSSSEPSARWACTVGSLRSAASPLCLLSIPRGCQLCVWTFVPSAPGALTLSTQYTVSQQVLDYYCRST